MECEVRNRRRQIQDKVFRNICYAVCLACITVLAAILWHLIYTGGSSFYAHRLKMPISQPVRSDLEQGQANWRALMLDTMFHVGDVRRDKRELVRLVSDNLSYMLTEPNYHDLLFDENHLYLPLTDRADLFFKYAQDKVVRLGCTDCLESQDLKQYKLAVLPEMLPVRASLSDTKMPLLVSAIAGDMLLVGRWQAGQKHVMMRNLSATATVQENTERNAGNWQINIWPLNDSDLIVSDIQAAFLDKIYQQDNISISWIDGYFFRNSDSRNPEIAGIYGAFIGSLMTMLVCMLAVVPIGIGAAVYLVEFSSKDSLWLKLVEISIRNLAAVPSIIYGLLGLSVFLNFLHWPRSSALVGGAVLAMLTLPIVVVVTKNALRAYPDSLRFAALALGATRMQMVFQHVLPGVMPGVLTGIVLAATRAFGETAPLLMIGMVAFVAQAPDSFTDVASVLPVQVFLWSDLPEAGYQARAAAAILVLMSIIIVFNMALMYIRNCLGRRFSR